MHIDDLMEKYGCTLEEAQELLDISSPISREDAEELLPSIDATGTLHFGTLNTIEALAN